MLPLARLITTTGCIDGLEAECVEHPTRVEVLTRFGILVLLENAECELRFAARQRGFTECHSTGRQCAGARQGRTFRLCMQVNLAEGLASNAHAHAAIVAVFDEVTGELVLPSRWDLQSQSKLYVLLV